MPKKRHTEEQIVAALRQGQVGEKVAEICRRLGISEGTYYVWIALASFSDLVLGPFVPSAHAVTHPPTCRGVLSGIPQTKFEKRQAEARNGYTVWSCDLRGVAMADFRSPAPAYR